MPYLSKTYPHREVIRLTPGAFLVPYSVHHDWLALIDSSTHRPMNASGFHVRPYPCFDVEVHPPYVAAGIYTDHTDRAMQAAAYRDRDRLQGGGMDSIRLLSERYNTRQWRDMYNAIRNHGRRLTGENGRDSNGDLRWRRWNSTYRTATRGDDAGVRRFGVELEFEIGDGHYNCRGDIIAAVRRHGLPAHAMHSRNTPGDDLNRWAEWGYSMSVGGWQGTYDATVDAELVGPPLPCDDDGLRQVNDVMGIIRASGGVASRRQGLHVHVSTGDLDQDAKDLLVRNLRAADPLLAAFMPSGRRNGNNTYVGNTPGEYYWDELTRLVSTRGAGLNDHFCRYNLGHIAGRDGRRGDTGTIEFRGFGHSLNGTKYRTWIRVCVAIVNAAAAGVELHQGLTQAEFMGVLAHHGVTTSAATRWLARTANVMAAAA